MRIKNLETVTVVAQRIGKSKKETILVDGEVYIKSCAIGLWNYVTACEANDYSYPAFEIDGRKATIEKKHKDEWTASLSVKAAAADLLRFAKESNREYQAKYKIIKIER